MCIYLRHSHVVHRHTEAMPSIPLWGCTFAEVDLRFSDLWKVFTGSPTGSSPSGRVNGGIDVSTCVIPLGVMSSFERTAGIESWLIFYEAMLHRIPKQRVTQGKVQHLSSPSKATNDLSSGTGTICRTSCKRMAMIVRGKIICQRLQWLSAFSFLLPYT